MGRRALVGGSVAAALALAAALAAPVLAEPGAKAPAAEAAKRFDAYPSCRRSGSEPARFCFVGDHPVAVLRALDQARVRYRVCIRGGKGGPRCERRRTRGKGERSRVRFPASKGTYTLVWFVNGRKVDRDRLVVRKRAVLHIGDSLGVGTAPYLPKALSDWKVSQSVKVARHAPEAVSILRKRGSLPGVIVMAIGGNDDPRNVASFRDAVAATRRIAGPNRCVVMPNHYSRKLIAGTTFDGYNAVLEEFDRKYRNFRMVNWAAVVRKHPGWLAPDGIHVNATGYQARARAIAKQVRNC